MGVLADVTVDGSVASLIRALRSADARTRRLGRAQYVRFRLPARPTTFRATPRDSETTVAVIPRMDGRPHKWASFTDMADDLRALDKALRAGGKHMWVGIGFPLPSAQRRGRRYANALRVQPTPGPSRERR